MRAHDSNSVPGGLSQPLRVKTPADGEFPTFFESIVLVKSEGVISVPSPVVDLGFSSLNSTTVCVFWRPPANRNDQLDNYVVSYTTDQNWSLEHLLNFTVATDQKKSQRCRDSVKTGRLKGF